MANDWALGLRSSIFTMVDLQYPNMLQSFGLVRMNLLKEPVYKRPSFHAMQHLINTMRPDMKPAGRLEFKANTTRELTVQGIANVDGEVVGAMLWYGDRIPDSELSWDQVDINIEGLELKDPVYVELITGRVFALPTYHGNLNSGSIKLTGLPLWDSPVIITERSAITLSTPAAERKAGGTTNDMLF
jgi:hypothetical protein